MNQQSPPRHQGREVTWKDHGTSHDKEIDVKTLLLGQSAGFLTRSTGEQTLNLRAADTLAVDIARRARLQRTLKMERHLRVVPRPYTPL